MHGDRRAFKRLSSKFLFLRSNSLEFSVQELQAKEAGAAPVERVESVLKTNRSIQFLTHEPKTNLSWLLSRSTRQRIGKTTNYENETDKRINCWIFTISHSVQSARVRVTQE